MLYTLKRIDADSADLGKVKLLSLSLSEPYCASITLDFVCPEDVEAFIEDVRNEARKIWPATGTLI